ncbi:SCP2 sterol-binding domain-containing protein [Motilimonas cestriensis]|uniref:Ubiquinone biosynthesis accessory factor UbiJ n=1 Tax=Motilimonas cestriensis TaxID=2742685 RepID=A0ABS8W7Z4_9GAMM|nr:SCP2 sterol-binding domain-containing protein [Motilimonas cestriensis]MCE2593871.1 SCP2 sterol-binding domain-containing protein [Motilimonas cestriensis]
MPLLSLISAGVETGINSLQLWDRQGQARRKKLAGKVFSIELKELPCPFYFVINAQQVDVLGEYEGEPDVQVKLSVTALDELKDSAKTTSLIKQEKLEVEGDIQLLQQFAQLLTEMDIDWEDELSRYLGDVLAHKLCYGLWQVKRLAGQQLCRLQQNIGEVITEEYRLAPGPLEVAYFCDEVSALEKRTHAALARLEQLAEQITK